MATWTSCPILHAQPQTSVPLFQYLITQNSQNVVIRKTILPRPSLGLFSHQLTTSFPKSLATVESQSFLCCLYSRLIITNHCGSSDINQLAVCPASDVEKLKVLLHCSRNSLCEKCNSSHMYFLKVSPLRLPILYISIAVSRKQQCISSSRSQGMSFHSIYCDPFQIRIIQCSGCKF